MWESEEIDLSFEKPQYVQAHINNCKCIPETVDELLIYIEDMQLKCKEWSIFCPTRKVMVRRLKEFI